MVNLVLRDFKHMKLSLIAQKSGYKAWHQHLPSLQTSSFRCMTRLRKKLRGKCAYLEQLAMVVMDPIPTLPAQEMRQVILGKMEEQSHSLLIQGLWLPP